ncbi:MATE family efflux transporter [Treponema sp. Marseille-Q3903]|uniref:MATE family efflux transporter n=1 Tax=Treponema sp. Marseille-Q3903 TaxID=2766703 RepID=UPI001651C096|nr:MATE family efflux transporter [Treponema sp. Marseille-Q3903]MBC6713627.1 MATE family efflux transporter [Treponema sp. Marseille-Q3903]
MKKSNQINMTEGSIFGKLLQFSIPLIFSSILQLLFNAADIIVVGRFAGDNSLAAVGSTGSLINLLVNLFTGLSIGSNVVAANYFGAGNSKELKDTVHTSILLSVYSGIILTAVGIAGSRIILRMMQAPDEVLNLATLYLKIYFSGITATMVYNFGSALLRAKGDTKRPLYILFLAGILNLVLNLIFVIIFKMDVAGVAWATVISQTLAAILIITILVFEKDDFHLSLHNLKINMSIFARIVKIGLPAGFQGIMFSFSNVIIQSSVNTFGATLIAGNSAVCNIEGFVYTAMNGFSQGSLTFCSQNAGAKKFDRIRRLTWISQFSIVVIGTVLCTIFLLFRYRFLGIYTKSPDVIQAGMIRCWVIFTTYYLCGMMDGMANTIRGIGHSLMPVISSLLGACLFRIIWLVTIFQIPQLHTPKTIFISYPVSWVLTFIANLIFYNIYINRLSPKKKKIKETLPSR